MGVFSSTKAEPAFVPDYLNKAYFPSLDGLRGVAILIVLFIHFGLNGYLRLVHFRIDSRFGVDIFFVLSGFLISTGLMKEKLKNRQLSLIQFFRKRALRTIPLVYLYLIILILLSLVYHPMASQKDFLASFLFLKNLPMPNEPFTAHLWTIAVEWQFYLIFALIFYFLNIKQTFFLTLSIVILFPLLSIIYTYGHLQGINHLFDLFMKLINYSFWKGPVILLIGSVAAMLSCYGYINLKGLKNHYLLSFVLFLTALLFHVKDFVIYLPYISQYVSAILIAAVILLNLQSENFLSKMLSSALLIRIGILSYSLYIWQQLFIGYRVRLPGFEQLNQQPVQLIMLEKFVLVFIIATLSYRFYERPFLRLKNRYRD